MKRSTYDLIMWCTAWLGGMIAGQATVQEAWWLLVLSTIAFPAVVAIVPRPINS